MLTLLQFKLEDKRQSYVMRTLGGIEVWERGDMKDGEVDRFTTELQHLFEKNIDEFEGSDTLSRN